MHNLFMALFGSMLLGYACTAGAFVGPLTFSPSPAVANQPISVTFDAGGCHMFFEYPPPPTISGNIIDVVADGANETLPILCNYTNFTYTFGIGIVPPGEYVVNIRVRRPVPPFDIFPPARSQPLTVVTVSGAQSLGVPGPGFRSLLVLGSALFLIAVWRSRREPRDA